MKYSVRRSIKGLLTVVALSAVISTINNTSIYGSGNSNASGSGNTVSTSPAAPGPGAGGAFLVYLASIDNLLTPEEKTLIGQPQPSEYWPAIAGPTPIGAAAYNVAMHYNDGKYMMNVFSEANLQSSGFVARSGFSSANGGNTVTVKALGTSIFNLNRISGKPMLDDEDISAYNPNWASNSERSYFDPVWQLMKNDTEYNIVVQGQTYKWKWSDRSPEAAHLFACAWQQIGPFNDCVKAVKGQIKAGLARDQEGVFKAMQDYTTLEKGEEGNAPNKFSGYSLVMLLAITDITYDSYATVGGTLPQDGITNTFEHNIDVIKKYYLGGNGPEAKEHQVICFVPVAGQHENNSPFPTMYTFVDSLNDAYQSGLTMQLYSEKFLPSVFGVNKTRQQAGVPNTTSGLENYVNRMLKESFPELGKVKEKGIWMYNYFFNNQINPTGGLNYTGNTQGFWGNDFSWNNAIGSFDVNKQLWSPSGYSIVTLGTDVDTVTTTHKPAPPVTSGGGGGGKDESSSPPVFSYGIKANPKAKDLTAASNDGANCVLGQNADIEIDISGAGDSIAGAFAWMNNKFKDVPNKSFRLTLFLDYEQIKGNSLSNTIHYDTIMKGMNDWTLSNVDGQLSVQSKDCKTLTELNEYILGSKSSFSIYDSNVEVCENLINRYKVWGKLCVYSNGVHVGGTEADIPAKGTGNVDESGKSYDDASWIVKPVPHYYSGMLFETPYAEIKHNRPYAETAKDPTGFGGWEAMAGIPTTADVYLGAGATEYMVNVELLWKTQSGQRTYTVVVNNSDCWGVNTKCTWTCPGPEYDEEGNETHEKHSDKCGWSTGSGCQESGHRNQEHPGSCKYTYSLTVPIENFAYMDITALTLYKLDNLTYKGNRLLTTPYNITLNPEVGYYSFHDQDTYSSGNGRLLFNYTLEQANQLWGNTSVSRSNSIGTLHTVCKTTAVNIINGFVAQLSNQTVTVVSDYTVIETSEGYQNLMYHDYTSKPITLTSYTVTVGDFGEASDGPGSSSSFNFSKSATEKFEFNGTPEDTFTQDKLWKNNGNSSSNWSPTEPVTAGYNGEYSSINSKYAQSNDTGGSLLPRKLIDKGQPNTAIHEGNDDFEQSSSSTYNKRYVKTGLNINDSTTPPPGREWSSSDSKTPVQNGEHDTGNITAKYSRPISYKTTAMGNNYDRYLKNNEAVYTDGSDKINNIVVHNPVSNRDAVLISNSKEYDQRTNDRVLPPDRLETKTKCPRNSTCQYSKINCTVPMKYHDNSCYTVSSTLYNCNLVPNTHVHDLNGCGKWETEEGLHYWEWSCPNHDAVYTNRGEWPSHKPSNCGKNDMSLWYLLSADPDRQYYEYNGPPRTFKTMAGEQRRATGYQSFYPSTGEYEYDINLKFYKDTTWALIEPSTSNCAHFGRLSEVERSGYHLWEKNMNYIFGDGSDGTDYWFQCRSCVSRWNCNFIGKVKHEDTLDLESLVCNNKINTHVHTSACEKVRVLTCSDPHHQLPGQSVDSSNPSNHYQKGDVRCWSACNDDSKHKMPTSITLPDGTQASQSDTFINIDREFQIYYPDIGDFQQAPSMWGIATPSTDRGPGYYNNMPTDTWLRNKFVTFPMAVKDKHGNIWQSGEQIDLLKQPGSNNKYTFHALLANDEAAGTKLTFLSVGNNAREMKAPSGANHHTNDLRGNNLAAKDVTTKFQFFDIVGSIGSLKINDTGDMRFATLFNQIKAGSSKWLIPNVVPEVDYTKPNKIVSDDRTSLNDKTAATGKYHHVYGLTDMPTGGVGFPYVRLPLTPKDNPIPELRQEAMRPGYNLFMDVETVGSYQGQNLYYESGSPTPIDVPRTGLDGSGAFVNKMQIIPKYYELTLSGPDKGKYKEVDIYMYSNYTYQPVYLGFDRRAECKEYYNYLDWTSEAARRNNTLLERSQQSAYTKEFTKNYVDLDGSTVYYVPRFPNAQKDVIGTPNIQILTDIDRTYIGSSNRYGVPMWGGNNQLGVSNSVIGELKYLKQSQRWHFTMGLPSSSVFVYKGQACNDTNIKALRAHDAVIVCQINIKVKGSVWTLEYDGTEINNNIQITPGGDKMPPPPSPKDPIVVVYDNKKTAKDDMDTQGTH